MDILQILLTDSFWAASLRIATPLIFGVLGALICEKSGVLNLGIEGIFAAGAMAGWMAVWLGAGLWGGLLAAALTDISGASKVFDRGFVTYSYESKPSMLGIRPETIEAHGAVSAEVVAQMAAGPLAHSDADIAVAITGIAGPVEGSSKPEGRVWFAISTVAGVKTTVREFGAIGRAKVRQASVEQALALLLGAIKR